MSFIHPKKTAEEQETADWQEQFALARGKVIEAVENLGRRYGTMLPNEMVLDMRMKALVEFLIPAQLDRQSDPFDPAEADNVPTNVDRLQYEVGWYEKLLRMISDVTEQIQAQQGEAGLGQNGHKRQIVLPGNEDIRRMKRND